MALVVIGVLVWNFSSSLRPGAESKTFSEFMAAADSGQVLRVTITGNEITYLVKAEKNFRTYAPPQFEGLANRLIERGFAISASDPAASPWRALLFSCALYILLSVL